MSNGIISLEFSNWTFASNFSRHEYCEWYLENFNIKFENRGGAFDYVQFIYAFGICEHIHLYNTSVTPVKIGEEKHVFRLKNKWQCPWWAVPVFNLCIKSLQGILECYLFVKNIKCSECCLRLCPPLRV